MKSPLECQLEALEEAQLEAREELRNLGVLRFGMRLPIAELVERFLEPGNYWESVGCY